MCENYDEYGNRGWEPDPWSDEECFEFAVTFIDSYHTWRSDRQYYKRIKAYLDE